MTTKTKMSAADKETLKLRMKELEEAKKTINSLQEKCAVMAVDLANARHAIRREAQKAMSGFIHVERFEYVLQSALDALISDGPALNAGRHPARFKGLTSAIGLLSIEAENLRQDKKHRLQQHQLGDTITPWNGEAPVAAE